MSGRRGATTTTTTTTTSAGSRRRVVGDAVAGLASIPAGAVLSAALSRLDVTSVSGYVLVLVLRARYRQDCHERGMLLATVAEVLRRSDSEHGVDGPDEVTWTVRASELRAALVLTRRAADSLASLARTTCEVLPALGAAMRRGVLDQPRARVFQDGTLDLGERHARAVVAALLPRAAGMSTGELFAAIQEMAIELDPDWARRRYERVRRSRHVTAVINHDGTATMAGHNLPADEVAAAADRLDALAARVKAAGHPATLAQLRADIFLGRLDRYAGLTDQQLFDRLTAQIPHPVPAEGGEPDGQDTEHTAADMSDEDGPHEAGRDAPRESGHGNDGQQDGPDRHGPDDDGDGDEPPGGDGGSGPEEPQPDTPGGAAGGPAREQPPEACRDTIARDGASGGETTRDRAATDSAGRDDGAVDGRVRGRGVHLLVGLSTVAGLDRCPARLVGFAAVHAELARRVTAAPGAAWYVALVNPDGSPIDVFPLRTRPDRVWWEGPAPAYRHCQVWLHLTPTNLDDLRRDPPPGWEPVIAAIATRGDAHPGGPPDGDPGRRLPSDALRRWLWVRDRCCTFPGCRIPVHRTQPDHTVPYAAGGPTSHHNLACACGPDHDLRHEHGWRVHQPSPGHVIWTSPLGHSYHRQPPPPPGAGLGPMPEPVRPGDTDPQLIQAHEWIPTWAHDTCKTITGPPPPPKPKPPRQRPRPRPVPKPPPENDEPPF